MPFTIKPVTPTFACELIGADLRVESTPQMAEATMQAMDAYGVSVFRDQQIGDEQQIAFSRLFGPLESSPHFGRGSQEVVRMKYPELFDVSNLDENNQILEDSDRRRAYRNANLMWHTDSSFQPGGAGYSILSARVIPGAGADTEFADMRAAYDALPSDMKRRIEGLVVEHSAFYSRKLVGFEFTEEELQRRRPTKQFLVQTHPRSGRKSLFLASHASHVVGMPVEEGRALLKELTEFATQPQFVYQHKWRVGDLLLWDNRCTMHRATPFDDFSERRDLRRTTVVGDLPLVEMAEA
ncbi:TauD/TfdA family dioxygenase [Ramlibacter sp. AW1]|uniref:TauD/TfdA family dioxygenase n=1 Tax=Ramlibacter aurantiacus TaxID=2801330 RepID=A0A936ZPG2_9BURK|nr:TauD/TfdA family dioxygenase [Ramlibacter aurantiacus]MBL0421105.1 TauD/TfdA family dioxygenase [Ramlibacter aurantiacus]